jgi:hypothetical protein
MNSVRAAAATRLDTFVSPIPSPLLMRAVTPIVSWLCLSGTPMLRELPMLNRIPGITGLSDIIEFDLPRDDELRLRAAVNASTAAFVAPNHPEFFTDWMLDKMLTAKIAPNCACWATNSIVNGLGALAQGFWLRNGLIAQIPGGATQGKAWSVDWALQGNAVLLHPEGDVGWHGDRLAPLFAGVVDMAIAAAIRSHQEQLGKTAMIAPVVWKLAFTRNVDAALRREIGYVAGRLGLNAGTGDAAEQMARLYDQLLTREENSAGFTAHGTTSYANRQRRLMAELGARLATALPAANLALPSGGGDGDLAGDWSPVLRQAERQLRQVPIGASVSDPAATKALIKTMRRLMRFRPDFYPAPQMTQEHVAECIKRLRHDYCAGTLRDTINRFVPQPVGPRVAHIRAPEPINISALLGADGTMTPHRAGTILADLQRSMQSSLDQLAVETAQRSVHSYDNPWR